MVSELIRKFTMGHPGQMVEPVIWHFLEGFTMTFPAVAVYFAINLFIEYFNNPSVIFDKGYLNIALWMIGFFVLTFGQRRHHHGKTLFTIPTNICSIIQAFNFVSSTR